jgi:TM2 domain-containing membrane protein YozV
MSKEDYQRIIAAEAVVANEKKSTALAYVFAILLGGAGAHNFYLGRPWRGALNLTLLVLSFVPQIGVFFLVINGLLVIWDLFTIPSVIRSQVNAIRARFRATHSDDAAVAGTAVLQPVGEAAELRRGWMAAVIVLFLIFLSAGMAVHLTRSPEKAATVEETQTTPEPVKTEDAGVEKAVERKIEPPQPVEAASPSPATEATTPAPAKETTTAAPTPRKGKRRKESPGKVEMSPQ